MPCTRRNQSASAAYLRAMREKPVRAYCFRETERSKPKRRLSMELRLSARAAYGHTHGYRHPLNSAILTPMSAPQKLANYIGGHATAPKTGRYLDNFEPSTG